MSMDVCHKVDTNFHKVSQTNVRASLLAFFCSVFSKSPHMHTEITCCRLQSSCNHAAAGRGLQPPPISTLQKVGGFQGTMLSHLRRPAISSGGCSLIKSSCLRLPTLHDRYFCCRPPMKLSDPLPRRRPPPCWCMGQCQKRRLRRGGKFSLAAVHGRCAF